MGGEVATALAARDIVKSFEGVHALRGVSFEVRPGEIHALLGENGAGKSTLIKVLTGAHAPDSGQIEVDGHSVDFGSVREARRAGVVALYQELSVVPTISVAENILLGEQMPTRRGFVDMRAISTIAQAQLDRLNQRIPTRSLGMDLSPVQQTMVSLARALVTDARVLILDEPTASLTDSEIRDVFQVLRTLRAEGVAIVYVSHRLEEVFELCDRLTVMRNGERILTKDVGDSTIDEVISTMVGRRVDSLYPERGTATGRVAMAVDQLSGRRVRDISFDVQAGEVLGIGGLAGSGRSELLRLLAGAQHRSGGAVIVDGVPLPHRGSVRRALDSGVALVPEERRSQGVISGASIQDNIAIANIGAVSRGGWIAGGRISALALRGISELNIKTSGPRQAVGELSGGNQQKVVLAKMLVRRPKVLLMDEPTRGIDVGTKAEIYRLVRALAESGTAVIAVSSELPELIGMSDRILILHEGRLSGEVPAADTDEEQLLTYCYGRAR